MVGYMDCRSAFCYFFELRIFGISINSIDFNIFRQFVSNCVSTRPSAVIKSVYYKYYKPRVDRMTANTVQTTQSFQLRFKLVVLPVLEASLWLCLARLGMFSWHN